MNFFIPMNFSLLSPLGIDTLDDMVEPSNYMVYNAPDFEFPELNDIPNYDLDYRLKMTPFDPYSTSYPSDANEPQETVAITTHKRTVSSPAKIIPPPVMNQRSIPPQLSAFLSSKSLLQMMPAQTKQKKSRNTFQPIEDENFNKAIADPALRINPLRSGFIPRSRWNDKEVTFGELVAEFFHRKNNANCRFSYKLYNALKLSSLDPKFESLVGVKWLNDRILRVDKLKFANLLGIKSIDGSLFHQQGNFPSHGFVEMNTASVEKLKQNYNVSDVDFENIRLLTHSEKIFVKGCTEKDLESCKWVNSRPRQPKIIA